MSKVEKAWREFVNALGRDTETGVNNDSGPWAQVKIDSDGRLCTMRFHRSGRVLLFCDIPDIEINIDDISDHAWIAWGRYRDAVWKHLRANMPEEIGKLVRGAFEKDSVRRALTGESKLLEAMRKKGGTSDE